MKGKQVFVLFLTFNLILLSVSSAHIEKVSKQSRKVRAADCAGYQCIIENDTNSWCIVSAPPMLQVGWEIVQTFSSETISSTAIKYWNVRVKPYAQGSVYIQNILDMSKLYYNEFTVDLDSFMANLFLEIRTYYDTTFCFGVGYQTDSITFRVEMAQKFQNCYKTLIKSLCDFSNWQGTSALWLDQCELSDDVTVTLYQVDPIPNALDNYWFGGSTADLTTGSGCK